MSFGSNDREMFFQMLLLVSEREVRNVLLMPESVTKLPMCGGVVLCVVLLLMIYVVVVLCALLLFCV